MRYVAVFQAIRPIACGALRLRLPRSTMRDYDSVLDTVGKEMGKVRSVPFGGSEPKFFRLQGGREPCLSC